MRHFLRIFLTLFCSQIVAQVGINTTDPKSLLDIPASNAGTPTVTDGILIPRINAFPATNPGSDQNGMLVFLTTPSGTNAPGFYYWEQATTSWVPVGNNTHSGWKLTGNTANTSNFIGTSNNQSLLFRTNNIERLNLTNTGKTFIGTTIPTADTWAGFSKVIIGSNDTDNDFTLRSSGGDIPVFNILRSSGTMATPSIFSTGEIGSLRFWRYSGVGPFDGYVPAGRIVSGIDTGGNTKLLLSGSGGSADTGVTIMDTGFVGVGTSSPTRKLHIVNTGASGGTPFGTAGLVLESNEQVYQQFLTPSTRESGLLFGNQTSAIRAGILFNSGHPDGLSFRTGGNNTRMAITNAGDMGMGTLAPQAALDIIANDNGVLVPRVLLTAGNVQAPVVNPAGGALPESTLVYNTNSAGTVPNEVTPGFYYWQNNRWNRLGNENKTRYYTALGTTNYSYNVNTSSPVIPQMSLTLTPTNTTVIVKFNACGRVVTTSSNSLSNPSIAGIPIPFRITVDGTTVQLFSAVARNLLRNTNEGAWDISYEMPVTVTAGVSQTISIEMLPTGSSGVLQVGDIVQQILPPTTFTYFGIPYRHHRVLTVIDP